MKTTMYSDYSNLL